MEARWHTDETGLKSLEPREDIPSGEHEMIITLKKVLFRHLSHLGCVNFSIGFLILFFLPFTAEAQWHCEGKGGYVMGVFNNCNGSPPPIAPPTGSGNALGAASQALGAAGSLLGMFGGSSSDSPPQPSYSPPPDDPVVTFVPTPAPPPPPAPVEPAADLPAANPWGTGSTTASDALPTDNPWGDATQVAVVAPDPSTNPWGAPSPGKGKGKVSDACVTYQPYSPNPAMANTGFGPGVNNPTFNFSNACQAVVYVSACMTDGSGRQMQQFTLPPGGSAMHGWVTQGDPSGPRTKAGAGGYVPCR
jgi:hypothetical protein